MASRRSAASRKQPSQLLESERQAKIADAAQKLFDEVVLRPVIRDRVKTPDIARGVVQLEVSCIQEALRRNMPVALKSWPKISIPVFKLHSEQVMLKTVRGFSPEELALLLENLREKGRDWIASKFFTPPALVPKIEPSETKTQGRTMREQADRAFVQDGITFFPLSAAAPVAQAPASTLLDWIKKKTQFNGRPLQGYHFAPANRYFLSEESIERAANRFVKWPSEEPAGPVTIGETKDECGYIGLTDAARTVGVDHHTMWRWATKGTAPTDEPIQVIKCPASDQYYVREKDVSRLKKLVPRSGLRRGRRPQLAL